MFVVFSGYQAARSNKAEASRTRELWRMKG
jgi:hypothetical protein